MFLKNELMIGFLAVIADDDNDAAEGLLGSHSKWRGLLLQV